MGNEKYAGIKGTILGIAIAFTCIAIGIIVGTIELNSIPSESSVNWSRGPCEEVVEVRCQYCSRYYTRHIKKNSQECDKSGLPIVWDDHLISFTLSYSDGTVGTFRTCRNEVEGKWLGRMNGKLEIKAPLSLEVKKK